MAFHIAVLCISAIFVQGISANCIGNVGPPMAGPGYGVTAMTNNAMFIPPSGPAPNFNYNGANQILPSSGGDFIVSSSSPFPPTGIQVLAENLMIEGPLEIVGTLPLLGSVAVEGSLPVGGQAGASYGCGNGNVGIINELGGAGFAPVAELGPVGFSPAGFGPANLGPVEFGPAGYGPAGFAPVEFGPSGFGPANFGPAGSNAAGNGGINFGAPNGLSFGPAAGSYNRLM